MCVYFCMLLYVHYLMPRPRPYSCQLAPVPNRWHSSVGVSSSSPRTSPSSCTVASLPTLATLSPAWRRQKGHSRREINWYVHMYMYPNISSSFIIYMYCVCTCSLNISLLCYILHVHVSCFRVVFNRRIERNISTSHTLCNVNATILLHS